ncbi:MAG: OmpA family protein [candidate division KSB1 bacterium]|nr:OmpA family protein [candidate division KSB1 bacterium]
MKAALIVLSIVSLALAGAGYWVYDQGKKAELENEDMVKDLNFKVKTLEEEKAKVTQELEAKIADISKEKEEEIARVKGTYDKLVSDMKEEVEQGQIKITQMADRLSVTLVDKILFPSGEADITDAGLKVMERVGNVLKNTEDKVIRVEGHTDNVPIHARLKEKFPTNWELSTARATNVVRFLEEKTGISPERLEAVGMSENHPVASNETAKGRSQNRRIEIALLPKLERKK